VFKALSYLTSSFYNKGAFMKKISSVSVYLDNDMPDYVRFSEKIRCGQVISFDEQGQETDHQELINNAEFRSKSSLTKYIAQKLSVEASIIKIID